MSILSSREREMIDLKLGEEYEALRKRWYEEDRDFRYWLDKFDSYATCSTYFSRLVRLYKNTKLTPEKIVKAYEAGGKPRQNLIDDLNAYIRQILVEKKYALAQSTWSMLVSLLTSRGVLPGADAFEIKQPQYDVIPPQYIPTQDEFDKMLRYAECARDRFLLGFLRYTGARIGAIDDPYPMRLSFILDLDFAALARGEISFKHSVSCAVLIYGDIKAGEIVRHKDTYVGFMLSHAMQLLREYLEERIREGEKLDANSYLFTAERSDAGAYLQHRRLTTVIAEISKKAGFTTERDDKKEAKFTAHSLRRLFYNTLQGLEDVDREALQGHIRGIRARYHASVDEMSKVIEYLRGRYEFGMRALVSVTSPEEQRKRSVIDYARMQGLAEDEINKVQKDLGLSATVEELRNALTQVLSLRSKQKEARTATNGGKAYEAKVIDESELVSHVEDGWEIMRELADKKIVIRRKPST